MAHLDITHHFGAKLAERRRGGLILVGAMGAENGIPCIANDGAAKAYVHSLGEALHYEFKPLGVYVTVLAAGFTNTPVLEKFGFDPKTMPMKPMSVEQCVLERFLSRPLRPSDTGDMLMLHGRFSGHGQPANWIVLDIVRLQDGRLTEHSDVIEDEV